MALKHGSPSCKGFTQVLTVLELIIVPVTYLDLKARLRSRTLIPYVLFRYSILADWSKVHY